MSLPSVGRGTHCNALYQAEKTSATRRNAFLFRRFSDVTTNPECALAKNVPWPPGAGASTMRSFPVRTPNRTALFLGNESFARLPDVPGRAWDMMLFFPPSATNRETIPRIRHVARHFFPDPKRSLRKIRRHEACANQNHRRMVDLIRFSRATNSRGISCSAGISLDSNERACHETTLGQKCYDFSRLGPEFFSGHNPEKPLAEFSLLTILFFHRGWAGFSSVFFSPAIVLWQCRAIQLAQKRILARPSSRWGDTSGDTSYFTPVFARIYQWVYWKTLNVRRWPSLSPANPVPEMLG